MTYIFVSRDNVQDTGSDRALEGVEISPNGGQHSVNILFRDEAAMKQDLLILNLGV